MANQPPVTGKLIGHFQDRSLDDHGAGWSDLWDTGNSDLWDRGKPSPALIDAVEEHRQTPDDLFYPLHADGTRKKALVPGCGRGYDVVMLALHGFDAYGLEISDTAVKEAETYAEREIKNPRAYHFGGKYRADETPTRGTVTFLRGDFFNKDWSEEKFDLIYDYTFLCALHPSRRRDWSSRMGSLLQQGGLLVCLEFPMYKDPQLPGPPWGLNGVHWNLLSCGGDGIVNEQEGTGNPEGGEFVRTLYTHPQRSYDAGKGTDMLSVYARNHRNL